MDKEFILKQNTGKDNQEQNLSFNSSEKITFVLTSFNRPDLLEITLTSFYKHNTYPVENYIVIDDSGNIGCNDLLKNKFPEIEFIYNEKNIGQLESIDKAYKMVKTPWIFHCEEDWEFYRGGFIEASLGIMEKHPKIITVWLRALNDTNEHPFSKKIYSVENTCFRLMRSGYSDGQMYVWHGFTLNPGLKRKIDWEMYGGYSNCKLTPDNISIINRKPSEGSLSIFYQANGYIAAILSNDEKGYVRHIGWERGLSKINTEKKGEFIIISCFFDLNNIDFIFSIKKICELSKKDIFLRIFTGIPINEKFISLKNYFESILENQNFKIFPILSEQDFSELITTSDLILNKLNKPGINFIVNCLELRVPLILFSENDENNIELKLFKNWGFEEYIALRNNQFIVKAVKFINNQEYRNKFTEIVNKFNNYQ